MMVRSNNINAISVLTVEADPGDYSRMRPWNELQSGQEIDQDTMCVLDTNKSIAKTASKKDAASIGSATIVNRRLIAEVSSS